MYIRPTDAERAGLQLSTLLTPLGRTAADAQRATGSWSFDFAYAVDETQPCISVEKPPQRPANEAKHLSSVSYSCSCD